MEIDGSRMGNSGRTVVADGAHDISSLEAAFLAGFTTGRTGRYYGAISDISRRAATTEFEAYFDHLNE